MPGHGNAPFRRDMACSFSSCPLPNEPPSEWKVLFVCFSFLYARRLTAAPVGGVLICLFLISICPPERRLNSGQEEMYKIGRGAAEGTCEDK